MKTHKNKHLYHTAKGYISASICNSDLDQRLKNKNVGLYMYKDTLPSYFYDDPC